MIQKASVLAIGALLAASVGFPAEFPLEIKRMTLDEALSAPGDSAYAELKTSKPDAIRKQPKARSERPLYGVLGGADKDGMAFRVDESQGKGKGCDLLIFDLNRNGDLTDDPVHKRVKNEGGKQGTTESALVGGGMALFGPIEAPAGGKNAPRMILYAEVLSFGGLAESLGISGQMQIKPGCSLETTVDLDGVRQKIALVDANGNFRFGDKTEMGLLKMPDGEQLCMPQQMGDTILRDRNGSGKFESDGMNSEADPWSSVIYFGANPYTLTVTDDLAKVAVEPYSGPMGELAIQNGARIEAIMLARETSADKWEAVVLPGSSAKVKVPVGTYQLLGCQLAGKDGGAVTMAGGRNNRTKSTAFSVEAGKSATLKCGPPLQLQVQAERRAPGLLAAIFAGGSRAIDINLSVVGAGGEIYNLFRKGDGEADPPKFKILDEQGKEIASGDLEYG